MKSQEEIEQEVECLRQVLPKIFTEGLPLVITMMQALLVEAEKRGFGVKLEFGLEGAKYKAFTGKHGRLVMFLENVPNQLGGPLSFHAIANLGQEASAEGQLVFSSGFAETTVFNLFLGMSCPSYLCPPETHIRLDFDCREGVVVPK